MAKKNCSYCGTTILVGLKFCPSCLRAVQHTPEEAFYAKETTVEKLQTKLDAFTTWLTVNSTPPPLEKNDPRFAHGGLKAPVRMSMSEGYTRVVCPECLVAQCAPFDQASAAINTCSSCRHEFPGAFAAEFRKGADLACFQCHTTTFCITGLKVTRCPNCKTNLKKPRDPEVARITLVGIAIAAIIVFGFGHAVATGTGSQFLMYLGVGSVFTFFGFIMMVALGF